MTYKRNEIKNFVSNIRSNHFFTPDIEIIDDYALQYVFVYGTLKEGFPNSGAMTNSIFVSEAVTVDNTYRMFATKTKRFEFPVVLQRDSGPVRKTEGHIHGEIYLCPPETMIVLDSIEANGRLYQRGLHTVCNPERHEEFLTWMYIGHPDYWGPKHQELELLPKNKEWNVYQWL